jgi:hypothetical protein
MQRRDFLKLAFGVAGVAAGATALVASANAAPLSPISPVQGLMPSHGENVESAVVTQADVDRLKPEEVRWGHHWHRHWHRRHWGWHRRHWHRRRW